MFVAYVLSGWNLAILGRSPRPWDMMSVCVI